MVAASRLPVKSGASATQMANEIFGDGVTVVGASYTGDRNASGTYNDSTADQCNTEMDGFTITVTLTIPVNPGVVNSIRIGIADTADSNYDSNLLIAADSVQTGQVVTLKADGTLAVDTDLDVEKIGFTYQIENSSGQTDVGFVTVDTVPCFVADTLIRTPNGDVPVETLAPGDLVETVDEGAQPLRWIGMRQVKSVGNLAPVRFAAHLIDDIRTIFPDLDPHTGEGYGPAARPRLRNYEAQALLAARMAA